MNNWHKRFSQQANWTAELRGYIFAQLGLEKAARLLEIGCGTGAILEQMHIPAFGLDLQLASLQKAKDYAPTSPLTCADAISLPYADNSFDVVFSHFLWLWLPNPQAALAEMMRITRAGGHIIAFAEPDYTQRMDKPATLEKLGAWQRDALQKQGADPAMGATLTELFHGAGMKIVETGAISMSERDAFDLSDWELEWETLESDLAAHIPAKQIQQMKALDLNAWLDGKRILYVPTHYLWARMAGE